MRIVHAVLLVAVLFLVAGSASAQFNSMAGDWWLDAKKDRGVVKLTFAEEQGSSFVVTGAGFSRGFGMFWAVSDEEPQSLAFDFQGNISGTIDLEDLANEESLGTLTIASGKVNSSFTKIKLKGTLALDGEDPRKITIKGERLPTTPPAWTGRTHQGKVSGTDVRSDKYDLRLEHAPVLGFPFLLLTGTGSVKVDGVARTDVQSGGILLASPDGDVYGEFLFDLEAGTAKGRIRTGKESKPPRLRLKGKTDADRKVKLKGDLEIPVSL